MATDNQKVDYHGYNTPREGQRNWHEPLNENFRRIDHDVEVRGPEASRAEYEPVQQAKYLATDTGRIFIGDGSTWQPLPSAGTAGTPDIVCYEADGTSYAETRAVTYTGACIFAAAQQAVDAKLAAESGNVEILVKPGEYDLTTNLLIDKRGGVRVSVRSPGWGQARLNTHNLTGSAAESSVIAVAPGKMEPGQYHDRPHDIRISGFHFNDSARDGREVNAIYLGWSRKFQIQNCRIRGGYQRGLYIRACWQGIVNNLGVIGCGKAAADAPAIQVGNRNDTQTHQATNHIQFNHLQGDPNQGFEQAFFEARGKVTRIDVSFPNVELDGDDRGFVFDGRDGQMRAQIRGCQITGGAPAVKSQGSCHLQIFGGSIDADETAIEATEPSLPKLICGGLRLGGGTSSPTVLAKQAYLNLSNFFIHGGKRGIDAQFCETVTISNGTIQETEQAGVRLQDLTGDTFIVNTLNLNNVASAGESPMYLKNVNDAVVSDIAAGGSREVAAVVFSDCDNVSTGNIVPGGNITTSYETETDSSFRATSGRAVVDSTRTGITIEHNLAETPDPEDIAATPLGPLGDATNWYVSDPAVETFEIRMDTNPGRDVPFGWTATL